MKDNSSVVIENIENLLIGIGNSLQCRIKQSCKIILILTFGKIRYQMLFLQYNSVEHHITHFLVLLIGQSLQCFVDVLCIGKFGQCPFCFIDKLIIEKLI